MSLKDLLSRRDRVVSAYRAVFENPEGEIVLAHLAKNCNVFDSTFVQGDPNMTALNEGGRRVVLSIFKMLNTDLNKLRTIMEDVKND